MSHDSHRRAARWPHSLRVALALAVLAVVLDAGLPGLPGAHAGLIGRLTLLLSGICPQRPAHTYTLDGVQLPIEARMLGMFGGLVVGIVELATVGRRRSGRWPCRSVTVTLLVGFSAMVFDGFNALFFDLGLPHLYTPDLRVRLGTGVLAGLALAFALAPTLALVAEHEAQDVAEEIAEQGKPPERPGWRDLGCAAGGGGLFAVGVASRWSPLLYPAALLGATGVVLAWLLLNAIALNSLIDSTAALRNVKRHLTWRGWWLLSFSVALAVAELALLAVVRSVVAGIGVGVH